MKKLMNIIILLFHIDMNGNIKVYILCLFHIVINTVFIELYWCSDVGDIE